jgi:hypothetical protein
MHIILGSQNVQEVSDKYTVLELDTFRLRDKKEALPAYCLIENIPIAELSSTENYQHLHANLIKNYKQANWKFCEDAIEHLMGKWNGEIDSFYQDLMARIKDLKNRELDNDWDGSITR